MRGQTVIPLDPRVHKLILCFFFILSNMQIVDDIVDALQQLF